MAEFLPKNLSDPSVHNDDTTVEREFPSDVAFLQNFLTKDKADVNVFSPVLGSFNIEKTSDKTLLFDYLNTKYKESKTEHFAERQDADCSGVMIDFDMYHRLPEQQVSNAHVEKLVEVISASVGKILKFEDFDSFKIAVIRRPLVVDVADPSKMILRYCSKKKMYKDGLHILIPELMLNRDQKRYLNSYILGEVYRKTIFDDVIFTNAKHDPIIDMASAYVPVFFVGSIKPNKERRNFYPLAFCWEIDVDEDGDTDMKKINLKKIAKYNIPLELSINNWGVEKLMKKRPREFSEAGESGYEQWNEKREAKEKEKTENEEKYMPKEEEIKNISSNKSAFVDLLGHILEGLCVSRAVDTNKWYGVLGVCKNLCSVYGLDTNVVVVMLDKFSQRGGSRYIGSIEAVRDKFDAMSGRGYMGLLWHWLKEDNMPLFKKYIKEFFVICPPPKNERPNEFDFTDSYDYFQLRNEFSGKCFNSLGDMTSAIKGKYNKVISHILSGEGVFIKKIGEKVDITKRLGSTGFNMYYMDAENKVKKSFEQFVMEQIDVAFPKIICSLCGAKGGFNIWTGFQAKRVNLALISDEARNGLELIKEHIMEVWANNNVDYYNYIISWFAGIFTNLTSINKKALVMISPQGCGKGTMIEFLSYLLKMSNIYNGVGVAGITQKHNTAIQNKRLVVINEMSSTKDEFRSNFDKLKSYITDPIISIEPKGVDPYQIENISDYILFTNHEDSLPLEQNERRYAVFSMNAKYANNDEYFGNIRRQCLNQDVADAFFTYLLDFPAVSLNKAPDTDIRRQLMNNTKSNPLKFLDSVKEEQLFDDETEIKAIRFYQRYQEWCRDNGERTIFTNTKFATIVKKEIECVKRRDSNYYILPPNAS